MVFVLADEAFHLEAVVLQAVVAFDEPLDRLSLTEFILEVGVDVLPFAIAIKELDQAAELAPDLLQHRERDVLPELIGLDFLDQGDVLLYDGDRFLFF